MSDTPAAPDEGSTTITVRIDRAALAVLEWHARLTGYTLRGRVRDTLEAEAADISARYDLPEGRPPTLPSGGDPWPYVPAPPRGD